MLAPPAGCARAEEDRRADEARRVTLVNTPHPGGPPRPVILREGLFACACLERPSRWANTIDRHSSRDWERRLELPHYPERDPLDCLRAPNVCRRVKFHGDDALATRRAVGQGPRAKDARLRCGAILGPRPSALGPLEDAHRSRIVAPCSRRSEVSPRWPLKRADSSARAPGPDRAVRTGPRSRSRSTSVVMCRALEPGGDLPRRMPRLPAPGDLVGMSRVAQIEAVEREDGDQDPRQQPQRTDQPEGEGGREEELAGAAVVMPAGAIEGC